MLNKKSFSTVLAVLVVAFSTVPTMAFTPAEYSWDSHTIALYHMNESTGTMIHSADGNSLFDGTFTGSTLPQWATGNFGSGVQFATGVDKGAIEIPTAILNRDAWTLEMYIKSDGEWIVPMAGDNWIGDLWYDGDVQVQLKILDNGNARLRLERNDISVDTYWNPVAGIDGTTFGVVANTWTHVAFTMEWTGVEGGTGMVMSIYINGQLVARNTGHSIAYNSDYSYFGRLQYNVPCANVIIDEVRISDIVRTSFGAPECGSWGYYLGDVNKDCYVDINDFAEMAKNWLGCTHPVDPLNCVNVL
jgi:hypothetical protein